MRLLLQASKFEMIRRSAERQPTEIEWPDHVPVPVIGDELAFFGSPVTIVDREYAGEISRNGVSFDLMLTLVWRDRRTEVGPVVRDRELGPDRRPEIA
jgi:hypothetical protein